MERTTKRKIASVSSKSIISVLTAVLLLAMILNFSMLLSVSRIKGGKQISLGYAGAIVSSGSMEPAISVGDLIIIKGFESYVTGDIVTYFSEQGSLITHRVVSVSDNGYVLQGDSNNIPDGEIPRQRIIGKVIFTMPGAGGIINWISSPVSIIFIVCIVLLIVLIKKLRDKPGRR